MARRAGLSERRYGHYVTGNREPGLDTLLKIAKALGTTPDGLLLDQQLPAGLAEPEDQFRPITRLRAIVDNLTDEELDLAADQIQCILTHRLRTVARS